MCAITPTGELDRPLLRDDEFDQIELVEERATVALGDDSGLVEEHGVELAYAHSNFAGSMAASAGLPHQIDHRLAQSSGSEAATPDSSPIA